MIVYTSDLNLRPENETIIKLTDDFKKDQRPVLYQLLVFIC